MSEGASEAFAAKKRKLGQRFRPKASMIDASFQVSVDLAEGFQSRRLF
jgi:hypothetical protein